MEIDPSNRSLAWVYDNGHFFFSRFTANCQRLPNGNTLILESLCRRLFEVTPEKEIVWEYILTVPAQRVYRYPYDYCEAMQRLPDPVEPNRPYPYPPPEKRTPHQKVSSLQMAELGLRDGRTVSNRDRPVAPPTLE